jgi:hypothetical protein
MAQAEEFTVVIGADGRIRIDFRGMSESSYRRIVEMLEETVGPVEPIEIEAGEDEPPKVQERRPDRAPEDRLKAGQKEGGG